MGSGSGLLDNPTMQDNNSGHIIMNLKNSKEKTLHL